MANLILQEGLSFVRYEADGTTNAYGVTFNYLTSTDVKAFVNGDPATYTYINASEIALDTPAESGDNVVLNRSVKNDARYVNFQDGGQIREKTLDLNSDQIFFMAQEAIDTAGLNLFVSPITGTIDMKGSRVINVGDPIDPTDAMNYRTAIITMDTAAASAAAAAASAIAAAASQATSSAASAASITARNQSEFYAVAAQTFRNDAQAFKDTASTAATSATASASTATTKAAEAVVSATAAAASATAAAASATSAQTSSNNAGNFQSQAQVSATNALTYRNAAETFRNQAEDFAMAAAASIGNPSGAVVAYAGLAIPAGYLLCDGAIYLVSSYPNLAAALWDSVTSRFIYGGTGNLSLGTFNTPDLRGNTVRGFVDVNTVNGSGTSASNNATFTNHKFNRTGFKCRLASGVLTGLAASTDYFAIVIDDNTLAFASSYANALAGTKIVISGANSAVLTQWEDPNKSTRLQSAVGGNTSGMGSKQEDSMQGHKHNLYEADGWGSGVNSIARMATMFGGNAGGTQMIGAPVADTTNGTPRVSFETRMKNLAMNYIVKY